MAPLLIPNSRDMQSSTDKMLNPTSLQSKSRVTRRLMKPIASWLTRSWSRCLKTAFCTTCSLKQVRRVVCHLQKKLEG